MYRCNICKADCSPRAFVKNTCARPHVAKHSDTTSARRWKISMHSNALVWALFSVSLSHTFKHTHTHSCTHTRRAAHLANRPHYTGGWTIDPLVEELKKSPFSSPPSRMCDTMSWSYLPALCSIKANLTCSPKTFHMTAEMSAAQCGRWTAIFFRCNFRGWEFEHFAWQWAS